MLLEARLVEGSPCGGLALWRLALLGTHAVGDSCRWGGSRSVGYATARGSALGASAGTGGRGVPDFSVVQQVRPIGRIIQQESTR